MKNLRKLMLMIILTVSFAVSAPMLRAQDSSPSLSVSDVKQIRELIVEVNYWKGQAAEEQRQKIQWQKSAANWERLFNSEKYRANITQQGRIDELQKANAELGKANAMFRLQADDDKRQLGEQAFSIRKLKSERKWIAALGFTAGFGAGSFTGYQVGRRFTF